MDRVDDDLTDFIRTSREKAQLKTLYDDLKSVSKKLQSAKVPLLDVLRIGRLVVDTVGHIFRGHRAAFLASEKRAIETGVASEGFSVSASCARRAFSESEDDGLVADWPPASST
ncbi:hypothetical protein PF007_g6178 [Phytophthora fragariae]|uniref:Uncharacterized protein n=1 Tax=Phytophthora fragariae TaxID=53985 RepID=A0A6A3SXZ3_9STRA|nr:hypothetical protein PF007_g6178 [Phytophthora fragariae]